MSLREPPWLPQNQWSLCPPAGQQEWGGQPAASGLWVDSVHPLGPDDPSGKKAETLHPTHLTRPSNSARL